MRAKGDGLILPSTIKHNLALYQESGCRSWGYPEVPHKEKLEGFLSNTMVSDDTKPQKDAQNTSLTAERLRG